MLFTLRTSLGKEAEMYDFAWEVGAHKSFSVTLRQRWRSLEATWSQTIQLYTAISIEPCYISVCRTSPKPHIIEQKLDNLVVCESSPCMRAQNHWFGNFQLWFSVAEVFMKAIIWLLINKALLLNCIFNKFTLSQIELTYFVKCCFGYYYFVTY